jgi:hypothetical protein
MMLEQDSKLREFAEVDRDRRDLKAALAFSCTATDMKQESKVVSRRNCPSSAAKPFRRVAILRKMFGSRSFRGTARRHIAVTALPQRKFAQPALPPVCRKTGRRK